MKINSFNRIYYDYILKVKRQALLSPEQVISQFVTVTGHHLPYGISHTVFPATRHMRTSPT